MGSGAWEGDRLWNVDRDSGQKQLGAESLFYFRLQRVVSIHEVAENNTMSVEKRYLLAQSL